MASGTDLAVLEDAPAFVEDVDSDETLAKREEEYQAWRELEQLGVITPTAFKLEEIDLSYDRAEALFRWLGSVKRRSSWYIGDLLVYSEDKFGESYAQLAHETGLAEQTLMNLAYVSKYVPRDRRIETLGHSVHAAVASLSPKEQKTWLARAAKHGWKRDELRAQMKAKRKEDKPPLFDENGEPYDDDGESVDAGQVLDVARAILRDATPHEDGQHHLIPNEDVARLRAIFGGD